MDLRSTLQLSNGVAIPRMGLGVYQAAAGKETREAVRRALELGYRHIDTAAVYGNEADVGAAIRESGVPRDEVFVTTKLWNSDQGYERAKRACRASLERLGLERVDLYLIHWPEPRKRLESWRALVELEKEGLVRAAGVSNFLVRHLEELATSSEVLPRVNQVEMSPFLAQRELRQWCAKNGVIVEAYSPLTRGERLAHPAIVKVARALGRTPAQVLIRWALEQDVVVLPKSVRRDRIAENARVFDFSLSAEHRRLLDGLDEGLHTSWDPTNVR